MDRIETIRGALECFGSGTNIILCYTNPVKFIGDKPAPDKLEMFQNADTLAHRAAQLNEQGRNVYYTPAVFLTAKRTKANARGARSLWVDVDVRDDKGFRTFEEARAGISGFLRDSNLPTPSVVVSGGGLHLYWTCDVDIHPDLWNPMSEALRNAIMQYGGNMRSDTAVVTNIAALLRLPGTYNHTRGAESYVEQVAPRLTLDAMFAHFNKTNFPYRFAPVPTAPTPTAAVGQPPMHSGFDLSRPPASLTGKTPVPTAPTPTAAVGQHVMPAPLPSFKLDTSPVATSLGLPPLPGSVKPIAGAANAFATTPVGDAEKPTYAQLLMSCALLRRMAEEPNIVTEAMWRYALNSVMQTVEGMDAAHEFSRGYDRYTEEETYAKATHAAQIDRPTLCSTLSGVSGDLGYICAGCPKRNAGASPIKGATKVVIVAPPSVTNSLEKVKCTMTAVEVAAQTQAAADSTAVSTYGVWNVTPVDPHTQAPNPNIKLPVPPKGFIYGHAGLGQSGVFAVGDMTNPIIRDLVYVDRRVEAIDASSKVKLLYRVIHRDLHGRVFTHYLEAKDLDARVLGGWLLSAGITTQPGDELRQYIAAACERARVSPQPPLYLVNSYGWYDVGGKKLLVTPQAAFAEDGSRMDVIAQTFDENGVGFYAEPEGANNSISDWCDGFRTMYGTQEHAAWFVLASLASVLFYPCQNDGSGVNSMTIVASGDSGSGKTFLTTVSQSVWQKPNPVVGNSTRNAIPKEAARARHMPVCVDDMVAVNMDTKELQQQFLFLATGKERSRSNSSNKLETVGTWRSTIFISTNLSVIEAIRMHDLGAGASARIIELRLPALERYSSEETLWEARDKLIKNYGALGNEMARRCVLKGGDALAAEVRAADISITEAMRGAGASSTKLNFSRMRRRMVAMTKAVADLMGDVLPFDCDAVMEWAVQSCMSGEFSVRGGYVVGEDHKRGILSQIYDLITANGKYTYNAIAGVSDNHEDLVYVSGYIPPEQDGKPVYNTDGFLLPGNGVDAHINAMYHINKWKRERTTAAHIICMKDCNGVTIGWYIASAFINNNQSTLQGGVTKEAILAVLGGTVKDGSPRRQPIKLPRYISSTGDRLAREYFYFAIEELQLAPAY